MNTGQQEMRVGIGFDIHRFVRGRRLVIGGVCIPHPKGLEGHSDADVLLHAVVDAILGAMGEGDIGDRFPDSDMRYKDKESGYFVDQVIALAGQKDYCIENLDVNLLAEEPKLYAHKKNIRRSLAAMLHVEEARVNIKAKTMEGLGDIGKKKAFGAQCVVLMSRQKTRREN